MIVCQRCLHKNADADGICARCGSPLTPDWAAVGQGLQGSQTAWPVAPLGAAASPTIARSQLETANPAQAVSAGLVQPPVDTRYERAPMLPRAPSDVSSRQRDIAPRIRLRTTNGKHFELAGRASYLIGRRDSSGLMPDVDLGDFDGAAGGSAAGTPPSMSSVATGTSRISTVATRPFVTGHGCCRGSVIS
jgi:hypothetical protein